MSEHGQEGPTAVKPTYRWVQVLRALAATMVVAHHSTIMLSERVHLPIGNWVNGSAGVDIFFVISGFVMMISSAPLRKAAHPAWTFLARRLERIVPMYWIVTTAKVLILLAVPSLGLNALGGLVHVITSYLFIPNLTTQIVFEPVVVVGWTLNYEMAFYVMFAVALAFRWRPLLLLAPILFFVPMIPDQWVSHAPLWMWFYHGSQLYEFLLGMLLGHFVRQARQVPWQVGMALLLAGMGPLLFWMRPGYTYGRGYMWGVPAFAVVLGAVSLEARWGGRCPRWALELGDASYSIYLVHTFTLPALGLWLVEWPRWRGEWGIALFAAIVLSIASGEVVYRVLERPMTAWFKGRRRTAIPANA